MTIAGGGLDFRQCSLGGLGIAYLARLVYVFAGKAKLGKTHRFRFGNGALVCSPNFPPFLRGIIFIGKAALSAPASWLAALPAPRAAQPIASDHPSAIREGGPFCAPIGGPV